MDIYLVYTKDIKKICYNSDEYKGVRCRLDGVMRKMQF
jgi:hypothetical protein